MKRLLALVLSVLCICALLCSCGGKDVVLDALSKSINENYSLSGLTVVEDTAKLNRYYQIDEKDVKQFFAEYSSDASTFCEVVIVEANDKDAANRISGLLNTHLDSRVSEGKSYNKEAVPMLEKCKVNVVGNNFVVLVISDKAEEINAEIEKAIS